MRLWGGFGEVWIRNHRIDLLVGQRREVKEAAVLDAAFINGEIQIRNLQRLGHLAGNRDARA